MQFASFQLPELTIRFCPTGGLAGEPGPSGYSDTYFCVDGKNLQPPLRLRQSGSKVVGIAGHPFLSDRFEDSRVFDHLTADRPIDGLARDLNGSFLVLIYDRTAHSLELVSDRFSSQKLYYRWHDGVLHASSSFVQLFDAFRDQSLTRVDERSVFEFLYFRRLFGTKTYERDITLLDDASVLRCDARNQSLSVRKYWQPPISRATLSRRDSAEALAAALRKAVSAYSSDNGQHGLLLSGGLDSRAVLAAAETPFVCFTSCPNKNNEYEVAQQVALSAGADHVFIPQPRGLLNSVVDEMVCLTNGEHMLGLTPFYGYGDKILARTDVIFTGLGLDVLFGGLYQPKERLAIMGNPSIRFRLTRLSSEITDIFLDKVKYRLKVSDVFSIVKQDKRRLYAEQLRATVEGIVESCRDLTDDPYVLWELMHLRPISRHYSFAMIDSIRTFADCRTPSLENDLLTLSLEMPPSYKANSEVYKDAIRIMNPALMDIRNANTNVTARYSQWSQSAIIWWRAAANRFLGADCKLPPQGRERSWVAARDHIEENLKIAASVQHLPKSDQLDDLGFLDMDALHRIVGDHGAGRHDHSVLLLHLVVIDRFLASR